MSNRVNIETIRASNCSTARTYNWDVFFFGAGDAFGPSTIGENGSVVNIRCQSATLPQASTEPVEVNLRAFTYKEAGGVTWNDIEFTTYETDAYTILQQLYAYHNQQFDYRTGTQRSKCEIEQTVRIVLQNLAKEPVATWQINGAMITELTQPEMSNDKAGAWDALSFTMFFDFAELIEGPNLNGPGFNPTIAGANQRAQNSIQQIVSEAQNRVGNQFA